MPLGQGLLALHAGLFSGKSGAGTPKRKMKEKHTDSDIVAQCPQCDDIMWRGDSFFKKIVFNEKKGQK